MGVSARKSCGSFTFPGFDLINEGLEFEEKNHHLWFKKRRCKWRTMAARIPLPSAHRPAWMLPYRKLDEKSDKNSS